MKGQRVDRQTTTEWIFGMAQLLVDMFGPIILIIATIHIFNQVLLTL